MSTVRGGLVRGDKAGTVYRLSSESSMLSNLTSNINEVPKPPGREDCPATTGANITVWKTATKLHD